MDIHEKNKTDRSDSFEVESHKFLDRLLDLISGPSFGRGPISYRVVTDTSGLAGGDYTAAFQVNAGESVIGPVTDSFAVPPGAGGPPLVPIIVIVLGLILLLIVSAVVYLRQTGRILQP